MMPICGNCGMVITKIKPHADSECIEGLKCQRDEALDKCNALQGGSELGDSCKLCGEPVGYSFDTHNIYTCAELLRGQRDIARHERDGIRDEYYGALRRLERAERREIMRRIKENEANE